MSWQASNLANDERTRKNSTAIHAIFSFLDALLRTYWTSLLSMEALVEQSLQPEHLWSTVLVYNSVAPCSCNMHAPTGTGSRAGLTGLADFTTHILQTLNRQTAGYFSASGDLKAWRSQQPPLPLHNNNSNSSNITPTTISETPIAAVV